MTDTTHKKIQELVVCANMFVVKDGKVLMLKRSPNRKFAPNFVHPPGGKLEKDEDAFSGAQRELMEEAGLTVSNIRHAATILEIVPHKELPVNWLIYHFVGDYASGELITTDEGEFVWLSPEEIPDQLLYPSVRETIEEILNPNSGPIFAKFEYDDQGNLVQETKQIHLCAK
ncbi:NUDIX domain-containing protein [Candidatus Uhrbacteria bacterium]|nr:NUDIX domain-containing protein [Candidatus Uhrbacteria bacterium]